MVCADDCRPGPDRRGVGDRGAAAVVAEAAGVQRAARARAGRARSASIPGRDVEVQATEVIGQRKLLKWSVPGAAHAATFWGFIVLLLTIIEAYGELFSRTFAIPGIGHWAVHRVHRGPVRRRRAGRDHHLHRDPDPQQPAQGRPQVTVLRLAHPRRLGRPRDDLPGHRDAAALPGRADQHRRVPLRARRVRLPDRRALAAPAGLRGEQRAGGGVHPGPDRA